MALNNSIAKRPAQQEKVVEYQVNGETIKLSPNMVRTYLTNGNGQVTDAELAYFINLCKYQKLNPLIKECHLVKYGSQPATMIVGKDALLKRAMRNPRYAGHQAGVIVLKENGELEHRTGSVVLEGEKLVGGWAKTFVQGYEIPIEAAVSFKEYAGTTKDGNLNSMWSGKPGTMIRKTALVNSLREAFPEDLSGLYAAEEVGAEIDETTMVPVDVIAETESEDAQDYEDATPEQQTTMELQDF